MPAKDKLDLYKKAGIGGIIRMDQDGKNREVYATGVRNSVGIDFNPGDRTLWFTDNQVDGMGDDQPPGELNRAIQRAARISASRGTAAARCALPSTRTSRCRPAPSPRRSEMAPHAADLGITFYTGQQFPAQYKGGIFSAQHGSWNRTRPVGARIMFTPLKPDGTADKPQVFADGWLTETGEYIGRPVDVAQLLDGSLLVSDDTAGAIYRISYGQ